MRGGEPILLITGTSGQVGGALVERFLRKRLTICALAHRQAPSRVADNVKICFGDITRPGLGLSASVYRALTSQVTEILHCAARTEFSISRAEADLVNVSGARNMVAFARDCRKLRKVGVLSTVYVAGQRKGTILEEDLDHRAGFVNAYERSKYRMEKYLRGQRKRLPIAVYRLSTIIGDARTGRVAHWNAFHQALRLYHRGLIPMVPGGKRSSIDLISLDFATDAVFYLFHNRFQAGKTYHIVAGKENSFGLKEFLEATAGLFARFDERWISRAVSIPPVVSLGTFRLLESSVRRTGNSILGHIVGMISAFVPQLCYPKRFDDRNAVKGLAGSGIQARPLREYYPKIIRYCLAASWGSRG